MAYDEALAGRVRAVLDGMGGASEVKMMGGLCFMRGGHMACGVSGDRLMVRLGPHAAAKAVTAPGVAFLEVGPGRIADAFVTVAPDSLTDAVLTEWIARGLAFAASLPAKTLGQRRK